MRLKMSITEKKKTIQWHEGRYGNKLTLYNLGILKGHAKKDESKKLVLTAYIFVSPIKLSSVI